MVISAKISRNNFPQPHKLVDENDVIRNPPEISKKFNKYFAEIGLQISNTVNTNNASNCKAYLRNSVWQSIFLDPPETNEILNIIRSLNTHKASGYDNISSFFLCLGGKVLAPILSVYFGYALDHGIFLNLVSEKLIKFRFVKFFDRHHIFCAH